ncbi:decreased expression in renal and prostate cancer protein-like [Globicephala melas]|uniref:decreased expression in renal and prostate cancer protein-like n=1 Tax=Globicephala melas TaxID=9731 RepID=UPI0038730579
MQPATGGSAAGRQQGSSSPEGALRGRDPPRASGLGLPLATPPRGAERSGAVAGAPPPNALGSSPGGSAAPRAGAGARKPRCHLFHPPEDQTPTAPYPAGPGRAREFVCSPGPGAVGGPRLPQLGSGPQPRSRPRSIRTPGAPSCPLTVPARAQGKGLGTHASLSSSLSSRRALSPGWGRGRGRGGAGRGAGCQPQAGAGCTRGPRRVRRAGAALRAVRRVRGAPAAIQLPGLRSILVRGSQRAAAAARRSASLTERRRPAGAAVHPRGPAPAPGKRESGPPDPPTAAV